MFYFFIFFGDLGLNFGTSIQWEIQSMTWILSWSALCWITDPFFMLVLLSWAASDSSILWCCGHKSDSRMASKSRKTCLSSERTHTSHLRLSSGYKNLKMLGRLRPLYHNWVDLLEAKKCKNQPPKPTLSGAALRPRSDTLKDCYTCARIIYQFSIFQSLKKVRPRPNFCALAEPNRTEQFGRTLEKSSAELNVRLNTIFVFPPNWAWNRHVSKAPY